MNGGKASEHESPIARRKTSIFSQSRSSAPTNSQSSAIFTGNVLLKPFKTFFDLQELVDTKTQMFRNQPDITFELFARVIYSSRENFYKKQYFRFQSLLKNGPPYINGALLAWEVGSPLDCAAQELLKAQASRMKCFCRCKLRSDPRSEIGWGISVLEIRPTTWKEIQGTMDVLGRHDLDEPGSSYGK